MPNFKDLAARPLSVERLVSDLDLIALELKPGTADVVFVPGALRQDPEKPRTDPPEYVRDIQRLAVATGHT